MRSKRLPRVSACRSTSALPWAISPANCSNRKRSRRCGPFRAGIACCGRVPNWRLRFDERLAVIHSGANCHLIFRRICGCGAGFTACAFPTTSVASIILKDRLLLSSTGSRDFNFGRSWKGSRLTVARACDGMQGDRTTAELSLFQEPAGPAGFRPKMFPTAFFAGPNRMHRSRRQFPRSQGVLKLKVREVRPLDAEFLKGFRVRLNRTPITAGSIRVDGTTIMVPLPLAGRVDRREQRIELVCDPWFAPGDPRPLGIPVLGVTLQGDRP